MAQRVFEVNEAEDVMEMTIAANSEVFAEDSPVNVNSSGFLIVATAGVRVFGFSREGVTVIATNANGTRPQTARSTAIGYSPRIIGSQNVKFWADADSAWTQTKTGEYCDVVSVSAGVVTLNGTTTTSGQFYVTGLADYVTGDPSLTGDTTKYATRVAESQISAAAQA